MAALVECWVWYPSNEGFHWLFAFRLPKIHVLLAQLARMAAMRFR